MVDLPNMVERYLGFVIHIVVSRFAVAVVVITIGGVVATEVHVVVHVLFDLVPFGHGESTIVVGSLVVSLRSAESGERELVLVVDAFGYVSKIVVACEVGSLHISVAPCATAEHRDCPSVAHESGGDGESDFVVAVVTHSIAYASAFLGVNTFGYDIDGTSDRW